MMTTCTSLPLSTATATFIGLLLTACTATPQNQNAPQNQNQNQNANRDVASQATVPYATVAQKPSIHSHSAVIGADATTPEKGTGLTEQHLVTAKDFMLASANPLATQAGYAVLQRGGSAIDAMIAVQTTLGLVEPQSSGLGGGAFVVYWDNKLQRLTTFDARETAPLSATPELFLDASGEPLKFMEAVVGGRSVGTPGVPKMMSALHERYGVLPWASLFDVPITLAREGFVVSPRMAASIADNAASLTRYPETRDYFLPQGQPLQAGHLLKNPAYAKSVQLLASAGSAPFYTGQLAQNVIDRVHGATDNPGDLQSIDFERYHIIERAPVCADYRQYEVCGMGGSSSGGIAVGQILGIVNHFDPKDLLRDPSYALRVAGDASRLAFSDRGKYVGDPDYVTVPTAQLLSPHYLSQRADLIKSTTMSLPVVEPGKIVSTDAQVSQYVTADALELPSTSHIVIVDKQGNVLSMTSSIENAFGSTLMANGYLLNNELTDFSFQPEAAGELVANRVEGGKRPRSSMAPTIMMQAGKPYLAVGSPGGSRIIGYVAKTILDHVDGQSTIQKAISSPNVLNRFGTYELEQNTDAAMYAPLLEQLGYKTQVRDLNSGIQGIVITDNGLQGGADPRREGLVMGQ